MLKTLIAASIGIFVFSQGAQADSLELAKYNLAPIADTALLQLEKSSTQVILVDLWASWCEPCKESLPYYASLQQKYGEKIYFIGVSVDDDVADAKKFLSENKLKFAAYHDKQRLLVKAAKVEAIPMFFMLSPKGEIIASFRGSKPKHKKDIEEKLSSLLK